MKPYPLLGTVLCAALLCTPLSVLANSKPRTRPHARRECVTCGFQGDCRICVGGGDSAYCQTFNCGACSTGGTCLGLDMWSTQVASDGNQSLRISSKVIRDIGTKHPRFAITLAEMNSYGISTGERRVYWTPIPLTPPDVEAFLNKETHTRFFERYDRKVRRLNRLIQQGELSDIVYAVSVEQPKEGSWSITIRVKGDLAGATADESVYTTLEIEVGDDQPSLGQGASQKIVKWQLR